MTKRVKKFSTYYDEPFQSECSLDKDLELHLANEKKEKEHLNADVEYYMYITRVEKREEIINKINLDEVKFLIENFKEEKIIKHLYEIIESIVLA